MLKAIETVYGGYRFRSRLEARWAVFFDVMGIEYRYEPEGFDLDGDWYLPDFYLPRMNIWVEIKSKTVIGDIDEFHDACSKLLKLCHAGRSSGFLIVGEPFLGSYGVMGYGLIEKEDALEMFNEWAVFGECPGDCKDHLCLFAKGFDFKKEGISDSTNTPLITKAYTTARQARFEHGETPKWERPGKN